VGLAAAFGFIFLAVVLASLGFIALAFMAQSVLALVLAFGFAIVAIGLTGLLQSALTGVYAAALYRYATTGEGGDAFSADDVRLAFAPK
jgi:hypothetical protein